MDIDIDALKQPVVEDGPEPDLSDDNDFIQFEVDADGFFPQRADDFYFSFRKPNSDLEPFASRCLSLLERSRDVRLFVILAKIAALGGEVAQTALCIELIRHHLQEHWDGVQPVADGDSHMLRGVSVERLDEFASFVLPLQYAPLVSDRNGHVSYRDFAIASGSVAAREDDHETTLADIERVFERCEIETLIAARDVTAALNDHVEAIALIWSSNAQDPPSLAFKRLSPVLAQMKAFIGDALAARDPSLADGAQETSEDESDAAEGEEAPARPVSVGSIANLADAKAAMSALSRFFERHEPSSPAFLLVRKAMGLVGLTFPQVLQQIAPDRVYKTHIQLGPRRNFALTMERLSEEFYDLAADPGEEAEPTGTFEAQDRASAIALMSEIALWYRKSEPSNPIPLLLDRARDLMTKDFSALLSELAMPEE